MVITDCCEDLALALLEVELLTGWLILSPLLEFCVAETGVQPRLLLRSDLTREFETGADDKSVSTEDCVSLSSLELDELDSLIRRLWRNLKVQFESTIISNLRITELHSNNMDFNLVSDTKNPHKTNYRFSVTVFLQVLHSYTHLTNLQIHELY